MYYHFSKDILELVNSFSDGINDCSSTSEYEYLSSESNSWDEFGHSDEGRERKSQEIHEEDEE